MATSRQTVVTTSKDSRGGATAKMPRTRIALVLAIVGTLVVITVPAVGYYRAVVVPSNAWVVRVDGDTIMTRGELVHAIVVRQLLDDNPSDLSSLGSAPFLVSDAQVRDELTRRGAPSFGITVTEADVDAAIRHAFYPDAQQDEHTSAAQLEQTYRTAYSNFLNDRAVSNADYKATVESRLYREKLVEAMPGGVADVEAWLSDQRTRLKAEVRLDSDVYAEVLAEVRASLPRNLTGTQGDR